MWYETLKWEKGDWVKERAQWRQVEKVKRQIKMEVKEAKSQGADVWIKEEEALEEKLTPMCRTICFMYVPSMSSTWSCQSFYGHIKLNILVFNTKSQHPYDVFNAVFCCILYNVWRKQILLYAWLVRRMQLPKKHYNKQPVPYIPCIVTVYSLHILVVYIVSILRL